MAEKKIALKTTTDESFVVFAINTTLLDFNVCSTINQIFNCELQGKQRTISRNGKNIDLFFFSDYNQTQKQRISLIEVKTDIGPLFDFLRNVHFLLKISPVISEEQVAEFQQKLQGCEQFQFVQKISTENFSKQQLNSFNGVIQSV